MTGPDAPATPPKAYLFLEDGDRFFRFFFTKPRVLIGRAEDNDIVVREDSILPRHAEIFVAGPEYQLVAVAGSLTELNGEQVQGIKTLQNGDEIVLGRVRLLYVEEHRTSETALNLIIQREGDVPFGVTINKPMVRVGRSRGDVLIDDDALSATHLIIENFCEHGVFALDSRSERGTFLNGQPLSSRHRIQDGDTLDIGTTHILVRIRRAGDARKGRRPPADAHAELPRAPERPAPAPRPAPASRPAPAAPARPAPAPPQPRPDPASPLSADAPTEQSGPLRPRIRRTMEPSRPDARAERGDGGREPSPHRFPERPRTPERPAAAEMSPAALRHADGPDDRVRNTMRMQMQPGDEIAAPPWQGRTDLGAPAQHIVNIDGPVRSSMPEPLKRAPRRVAEPASPPPPAPRAAEPRTPPRDHEPHREAAPEPPRRLGRGDSSYHYLPGGSAEEPRGRDSHGADTRWPDLEPPPRTVAEPKPARSADDGRLDKAFKGGMTVAFPHATSATVDDGSPDPEDPRKYYHPKDRRR